MLEEDGINQGFGLEDRPKEFGTWGVMTLEQGV